MRVGHVDVVFRVAIASPGLGEAVVSIANLVGYR